MTTLYQEHIRFLQSLWRRHGTFWLVHCLASGKKLIIFRMTHTHYIQAYSSGNTRFLFNKAQKPTFLLQTGKNQRLFGPFVKILAAPNPTPAGIGTKTGNSLPEKPTNGYRLTKTWLGLVHKPMTFAVPCEGLKAMWIFAKASKHLWNPSNAQANCVVQLAI